jgi:hypothetical protein
MKKIFWFSLTVVLVLSVIACASTSSSGTARLRGVPDFVNAAYLQASEDVLIGIGTYRIGNDLSRLSTGKTMAETRARADIARQLRSILESMVIDYTATSELDPNAAISFQESITRALSRADLRGSVTKAMDTQDGVLWVVMEYSKSAAASDYNAAAASARLAVPAARAFDALERMDTAFGKTAAGGPIPVGE